MLLFKRASKVNLGFSISPCRRLPNSSNIVPLVLLFHTAIFLCVPPGTIDTVLAPNTRPPYVIPCLFS